MSENPYTMNSLGPVWQQGYDAGQAALQSQLEPGPCGVKGHRLCDWSYGLDEDELSPDPYCLSCRAVQEAVDAGRKECKELVERLLKCDPGSSQTAIDARLGFQIVSAAIDALGSATALADALRRARLEGEEKALVDFLGAMDGLQVSQHIWSYVKMRVNDIQRLAELRRIP